MSYTRTYIKSRLNAALKNKIGMLTSDDDVINAGVREAFAEMAIRSAKRTVQLSPNLFSDIYSYPVPQDMAGSTVVDLRPNDQSQNSGKEIILRTVEEFYRKLGDFNCAVDDSDNYRKLLVSIPVNDTSLTVSALDSISSGGGTWGVASSSTSNVRVDSTNYMKGLASLSFDINAVSGTTAGIVNSSLNTFDYTDFLYGSIFVWTYIVSKTDITNYKIRVGNDASNYYEMTVTDTHEDIPFQNGWNLLRFDMSSKTTTGSPTSTAGAYISLFMTKTTSKVSETGYAFDHIIFKTGKAYLLTYYTEYPWKNTTGTYLLESSAETDIVICSADEFDMVLNKIIALAADEIGESDIAQKAESKYVVKREKYLTDNPDESKPIISTYYDF